MKGWPVSTVETEKRRWAILNHLNNIPGYELNDELLKHAARAQGIPTTHEQIVVAIAWLEEMELVTSRQVGRTVIAGLTASGQDVATGDRIVPGVLRPGPGA